MNGKLRIGISGWTYVPWRGTFYPKDLIQRKELHYASRQLSSIEVNGTHYGLQKPRTFKHWYEETPPDFVFSIKGNRFITHIRRLREVEKPLANFFASGVLDLREKLGPFLWQLPPSYRFDAEELKTFLALLPRTTTAAAKLAANHDLKIEGQASLQSGPRKPLRHCLEVRHASFMVPEFFQLLRRYRVAFVFADTAGKWPYAEDLTSDFVYIRLHGDEKIYVSGYTSEALDHWSNRIQSWRKGIQPRDAKLVTSRAQTTRRKRDVFVYFDNDLKVLSPANARELQRKIEPLKPIAEPD